MKTALTIIHDEHRAISAVLDGLQKLARTAQDARVRPGFDVLRAMIRYIDEFPEKMHHPKEDEHLFARLALRAPEAKTLIEELRTEHAEGARLVRELERKLVFFEDRWPGGGAEFLEAVNAYAHFHWTHMRKEETELLPLAERRLTPEDWRAVDAAFVENPDFEKLFTRIANMAPAPIGLGERWQTSA